MTCANRVTILPDRGAACETDCVCVGIRGGSQEQVLDIILRRVPSKVSVCLLLVFSFDIRHSLREQRSESLVYIQDPRQEEVKRLSPCAVFTLEHGANICDKFAQIGLVLHGATHARLELDCGAGITPSQSVTNLRLYSNGRWNGR